MKTKSNPRIPKALAGLERKWAFVRRGKQWGFQCRYGHFITSLDDVMREYGDRCRVCHVQASSRNRKAKVQE